MRNGSILAQCRARAWDGLGPRLEQHQAGTAPSQSAANTPGGRGSGAHGDGGEMVEMVGMNPYIYPQKQGRHTIINLFRSFFKLFSDCLLQFYQQTHHTDKTLQLRAIILLVTRTFTRGEKCAEFLIMFSLINH